MFHEIEVPQPRTGHYLRSLGFCPGAALVAKVPFPHFQFPTGLPLGRGRQAQESHFGCIIEVLGVVCLWGIAGLPKGPDLDAAVLGLLDGIHNRFALAVGQLFLG